MLKKNESILIERASNGFIVSPKDAGNLTKNDEDLSVFSTVGTLKKFLDEHFDVPKKKEGGTQ